VNVEEARIDWHRSSATPHDRPLLRLLSSVRDKENLTTSLVTLQSGESAYWENDASQKHRVAASTNPHDGRDAVTNFLKSRDSVYSLKVQTNASLVYACEGARLFPPALQPCCRVRPCAQTCAKNGADNYTSYHSRQIRNGVPGGDESRRAIWSRLGVTRQSTRRVQNSQRVAD